MLTITLSSFLGNRCRMRPFLDEPREELETWFRDREQAAMRARQIRRWLLSGRAESFDQMTDLPQDLRTTLGAEFVLFGTQIASHLASRDGTHKLLLRLPDNQLVECVLIQEDARRTACIRTSASLRPSVVFSTGHTPSNPTWRRRPVPRPLRTTHSSSACTSPDPAEIGALSFGPGELALGRASSPWAPSGHPLGFRSGRSRCVLTFETPENNVPPDR